MKGLDEADQASRIGYLVRGESTISRPTNQFATTWVVLTERATLARADSKICRMRS